MSAEISLAKKAIGRIRKKQKLKKLVSRLLMGGVLFLGLVLMIASSLQFIVSRGNNKLEARINLLIKEIEELNSVESQQVYLISKLDSFTGLLETHELHQALTESIFKVIPDGTSLKGFQVNETGVISLSGTVPDFVILKKLFDNIQETRLDSLPIVAAKVNRIGFSQEGDLNFDMEVTIQVKK